MVLESTMVCVDNSDYMRNGDFVPTRLHAQQDAVNVICMSKTRSNPENNVGLLSAASNTEVLVTLTTDVNKLLARLHQVEPKGQLHFTSAIRVAHLVLKHRQGKNHRMRIVVFVGSPVAEDDKELVKLAKKLRKEKVNVDIVNFGEEAVNTDKLTSFINTLNGSEGTSSHLVTVSAATGPLLSTALNESQIVRGEDGSGAIPAGGYEFGIDPNEDPELALALRVSMEEQRARQEEESRKATAASAAELQDSARTGGEESVEEQLLRETLARSLQQHEPDVEMRETSSGGGRDLSSMTEEEQMAYALQMSMQQSEAMEEDQPGASASAKTGDDDDDYREMMNDPAFLQSVLEDLPGVNPQDEAIKEAVKQLTKPSDQDDKNKKKEDKK